MRTDLILTGAHPHDAGPLGCLAHFLMAETPDECRPYLDPAHTLDDGPGGVPPLRAADVGEPVPTDDGVRVPARLEMEDGAVQEFQFIIRPATTECGFGIDLPGTFEATFGADPMELLSGMMNAMGDAMGNAMGAIGGALGEAMGSMANTFSEGGTSSAWEEPESPSVQRLALDAVPATLGAGPESVEIRLREETHSRIHGEDGVEFRLNAGFEIALEPQWVVVAVEGVLWEEAETADGDDLRPEPTHEPVGQTTFSDWEQERRNWTFSCPFRSDGQPFPGFRRLSGRVQMKVRDRDLVEVDVGTVGDLVGQDIRVGPLDLTLRCRRDDSGEFTVQCPYEAMDSVQTVFVSPDGDEERASYSGYGDGETSTMNFYGAQDEAVMRLRFPGRLLTVELPFAALPR